MELHLDNLPFCGRQKEIKALQDVFHTVCSQKKIRVVTICGKSGTGKSELVSHFVDTHLENIWVCRGKYDANSSSRPYSAIADCYYQLLELMIAEDSDKWIQKLQNDKNIDYSILIPILPNIAKLLPPPTTEEKAATGTNTTGGSSGAFLSRHGHHSSDCLSVASSCTSAAIQDLQEDNTILHNVDRYVITLRGLIRLVCAERPLVFVYEDLQWIDPQSMRLQQRFRDTVEDLQFLMIGTNRPLPPEHPIRKLAEEAITNSGYNNGKDQVGKWDFLFLKEFDKAVIASLLESILKREPEDVMDLAALVHRKTGGNPCAVHEYLLVLAEKELLRYCIHTYKWTWDLGRCELETDVAYDDIVQLAVQRLEALQDKPLKRLLLHAALLGNSCFDANLLFHCMNYGAHRKGENSNYNNLLQTLDRGCSKGLLERSQSSTSANNTSSSWYKFCHDRVLEGAQMLLPPEGSTAREELHLGVGRQLIKVAKEEICDDFTLLQTHSKSNLFIMAMTHANQAQGLIAAQLTDEKRLELVTWNHMAADAALETASFPLAVNFLQKGLRLLGSLSIMKWKEHYDLTLALSDSLAYAYFCTAEVEKSEAMIDEILTNAKQLEHKLGAYQSSILCRWQHGDLNGALTRALSVVKEVANISFPKQFLHFHMIRGLLRMKGVLAKTTNQQIRELPEITDQKIHTSLYFLSLLMTVASFANAEEIWILSMIQSVNLTLKYGRGPGTVVSVAAAAFITTVLGDYENGQRLSKVGMEMVARNEHPVSEARASVILSCYCVHWKTPMHDCLGHLLQAANTCQKHADVSFLFFSCFSYLLTYYYCGLELLPLETDYLKFEETLADYGQDMFLAMYRCRLQQIHNLMGKASSRKPTDLTGDAMDQDKCMTEWKQSGHDRALFTAYLCRLELACYFDDIDLAVEMSGLLPPIIKEGPGVWLLSRVFFQGLLCFRLAQKKSRRRRANIAQGKRHLAFFKTRVAKGCINCCHYLSLLTAECNRTTIGVKDIGKVQRGYDDAIAAAGKLGFMQDQALGNELAGRFFLEVVRKDDDNGDDDQRSSKEWSWTYLMRAVELYSRWGAEAKVNDMKIKYKEALVLVPGDSDEMVQKVGSSHNRLSGNGRLSTARLGFVSSGSLKLVKKAGSRRSLSTESTTMAPLSAHDSN